MTTARSEMEVLEHEANVFALYLLMPSTLFAPIMAGLDPFDDQSVERVARKFQVPVGAVHYRYQLARERGK